MVKRNPKAVTGILGRKPPRGALRLYFIDDFHINVTELFMQIYTMF
jgi:hypothetical protein